MKSSKQLKGEYIRMLLDQTPVSRNQIATVSGLSNQYILELEKGGIDNVGREKLISFAIAINLSLKEIDKMMKLFDQPTLNEEDTPVFIEASARSKVSAALHPIQDSFNFDLAILSLELTPGEHIIVSPRPISCIRAKGHRAYTEKSLVQSHHLYEGLVEAINSERRRLLQQNLANQKFKQYSCIQCLTDYVRQCEDPLERDWRVRHIRNTIEMVDNYDNFEFILTQECPSFLFVLKLNSENSNLSDRLIITVVPPHRFQFRPSGLLAGFSTNNKAVFSNFIKELEFINATAIDRFRDRKYLITFLEGLK